jgi:hypothetical protein
VCEHKNAATEYPEFIKEWDQNKNGAKMSEYASQSNFRAWWKCQECQHSWQTMIANRINGTKCPKCNESKLEKAMNSVLNNLQTRDIVQSFEREYRLSETRLRADFRVVFHSNIVIIIETDEQQHFLLKPFGEKYFEKMRRLHAEKKSWCMQNKIHLLRISYLVKYEHYEAEVLAFLDKVKLLPLGETLFQIVGQPPSSS